MRRERHKAPPVIRNAGRAVVRTTTRTARNIAWPLLFTVALASVLILGVFPTRTYIQKRQDVISSEARLKTLDDANNKTQAHVQALKSDAEIEKIARGEYGLVKPGEEAYHVLPPPKDPVQIPEVWPFNRFHKRLGE